MLLPRGGEIRDRGFNLNEKEVTGGFKKGGYKKFYETLIILEVVPSNVSLSVVSGCWSEENVLNIRYMSVDLDSNALFRGDANLLSLEIRANTSDTGETQFHQLDQ